MANYTCNVCGCEFGTDKTRNKSVCPHCLGRRGGKHTKPLQEKVEKLHTCGYLYYDYTMLTADEKALLPNDSRTVMVHRLIMAKHLGRPIMKHEVIMHKNGNKQDNRIENLEIGTSMTNTRQHWEAYQRAEQWRRLSILLLALIPRAE